MSAEPIAAPAHARDAKLVYMANQIAAFFASYHEDEAVIEIENHLRKFWDPRMRTKLRAILAAGGEGLSPRAREAAARLAG